MSVQYRTLLLSFTYGQIRILRNDWRHLGGKLEGADYLIKHHHVHFANTKCFWFIIVCWKSCDERISVSRSILFPLSLGHDGYAEGWNCAGFHFVFAIRRWSLHRGCAWFLLMHCGLSCSLVPHLIICTHTCIAELVNGTWLGMEEQSLSMMREYANKSNSGLNLKLYDESGIFT